MNGTNYEVPHCGAFSTPHSRPSWTQYSPQDPVFNNNNNNNNYYYYCYYFNYSTIVLSCGMETDGEKIGRDKYADKGE